MKLSKMLAIKKELEEIIKNAGRIPDGLRVAIPPHDAYELSQGLQIQLVALGEAARCDLKLRQAQVALDQIVRGDYERCLACDGLKGEKRIDAVPYSPFCVRCQELLDGHQLEGFEHLAAA
jgi:RNA polymerase-binding transcription factor DksA